MPISLKDDTTFEFCLFLAPFAKSSSTHYPVYALVSLKTHLRFPQLMLTFYRNRAYVFPKRNVPFFWNERSFYLKRTFLLPETCFCFSENDLMFSLKRLDVFFKTTCCFPPDKFTFSSLPLVIVQKIKPQNSDIRCHGPGAAALRLLSSGCA